MTRYKLLIVSLFALGLLAGPRTGWAQTDTPETPPAHQPSRQQEDPGFPDLVAGLKATTGCLGVETAHTDSGKGVIFAWFRDKEAAMNWYNSDMHQAVMDQFFPNRPQREPMADIPDGTGPILAIASITMSDKPQFGGVDLPISQIAIELYTPLSGGLALGGRFAPDSVEVKGLPGSKGPDTPSSSGNNGPANDKGGASK